MRFTRFILFMAILGLSLPAQAQFRRKKKKDQTEQNDGTEQPQKKKKFGSKLKKFGNKMKSKAQGAIGNAFTKSTSDLSGASMTVMYKQNMYPENMIGNATKLKWEAKDDIVFTNFTNREGTGLLKIDGEVKLDGAVLSHSGMGIYGEGVDKKPNSHTVSIQTSSGQTAQVNIKPVPSIKIISINGVPKGQPVTINAREDLTLQLEHGAGAEGTEVTISFIGKIPGTTWLYDIVVMGSNAKITIPKEAFINPSGGGFKYKEDNYLVVSRNVEKVLDIKNVGAVRTVSSSLDWTPVTLKSDFEKNFLGQTVETADAVNAHIENNRVRGRLSKPNAFLGQPLKAGKKLAVASFVVRATKLTQHRTHDYSYKTSTIESTREGYALVTTKTDVHVEESKSFPKIPDAEWDKLVENFYKDFEQKLLEKWNITLVPIEKTIQASNYKNLQPIHDKITNEVMIKGYKGSKLLIPTSFEEYAKTARITFPSDLPEVRLMRELDVDGIIGVTIDCEMNYEDGALSPRMAIQITGLPNGYQAGPTVFMKGIFAGKGIAYEKAKAQSTSTTEMLGKIMQKDDLITAFGQAMEQMKEEEKQKRYNVLWDLKELK